MHCHYIRKHIVARDMDLQDIRIDHQTTNIVIERIYVDKLGQDIHIDYLLDWPSLKGIARNPS